MTLAEVEDIQPLGWVIAMSEKSQRVGGKTKENHTH